MDRLESWIEGRLGLHLDRAMRSRLHQLVAEAAASRQVELGACADMLSRDDTARQALVDRLVVPTTAFFRHPRQFEVLRARLAGWPDPVTIWSAGCSTGAEPYTIAMVLQESGRRDWRVVASDLSTVALETAAAGVYGGTQVASLDSARQQRHLEQVDGRWRVAGSLRERMLFVRHNLASEDVPAAAWGARAVFCRNVLIYLAPPTQRAFLERLDEQVAALELLFLGATESLWGVTDRFQPVNVDGAWAYQPARRAAPPAPSVPPARRPPAPAPPRQAQPAPARDTGSYMAEGQEALAAGRAAAAVTAFRRACYLDTDDPLARLSLALALDATGDAGARQAFVAARAAVERRAAAPDLPEVPGMRGMRGPDLVRLIEHRLRQLG